jgi:hypothetical protein
MIEHKQVVADCVIAINVASREQAARIRDGRAFLIKHAVANLLCLAHFGSGLSQPHFQ